MKGEFLSLETAKKIHNTKTEKPIDKNLLEAKIKLVDENKMLKRDNELLNNTLIEIKKLLRKQVDVEIFELKNDMLFGKIIGE